MSKNKNKKKIKKVVFFIEPLTTRKKMSSNFLLEIKTNI